VLDELEWVITRCEEHLGPDRAGRYLRKFYPWYGERLGLPKPLQHRLVTAPSSAEVRRILHETLHRGRLRLAA